MNQLQNYIFENQQIRVLQLNNEPWFVGRDIASILGYNEPHKAVNRHVDSDDGKWLKMKKKDRNTTDGFITWILK